ncbi:MAG: hypothetical protein CVV07_11185 [Gammaproteobacteria bacterium HGW-Gammaproteobacteria-11]|nr:MAG: hypothetical protein CVV07_11185 [Gammaproteobacteria bacterium HGW-Gammaproteobacteria-11]
MTDSTVAKLTNTLNKDCFCISLDQQALRAAIESEVGQPDLFELLQTRCPTLFASRPVFVSDTQMARMQELIEAIESVLAMPAYQQHVLANAPAVARHPSAASGVFMGYDFHVTEKGFGLIEINTNAGGAMLNTLLARAQRACCMEVEGLIPPPALAEAMEQAIVAMFHQEWVQSGHSRPLRSIAIVDSQPQEQYLYGEFLLFQQLFEAHGIRSVIADPAELALRGQQLMHGDLEIDLVYNRLTDFLLDEPAHAVLRSAYLDDQVVLTPNPRAHALYANKHNLVLLTQAETLTELGVPDNTQAILLAGIPRTRQVTAANADALWQARKGLFFKPSAGYGGRATYRGDKLTHRVWQDILAGDYVAQALVVPGQRALSAEPDGPVLKFDLRNYVYQGQVQWVAARLYQGQTTNFRTPGGGFAPVYQASNNSVGCMPLT